MQNFWKWSNCLANCQFCFWVNFMFGFQVMDSWSIIFIRKYKHNSWLLLEGEKEKKSFICWPVINLRFLRLKGLDNEWSYAVHLTACLIRIWRDQALNIILGIEVPVLWSLNRNAIFKFHRGAKYTAKFFRGHM